MKFSQGRINRIVENLELVLDKNIEFSGSYLRPVETLRDITHFDQHKAATYLSDYDLILSNYYSYVHKWFPANPHNDRTVERGNEIFVDKVTSRQKYITLPKRIIANYLLIDNFDPSEKIFQIERIIENNKYIIVEGNKGVGKTTFFNYWLNNRSKYLEKKLSKIWFRVDASKLYGLWLNKKIDRSDFDLESYHKVHSIYVISKYGIEKGKSIGLQTGWNHILSMAREDINIFNTVEFIKKSIEKAGNAPDGKDTERFLDLCIKSKELSQIYRMYDFCHECWLSDGYKIIYIVDGVDNISWRRETETYYDFFCMEIGQLFINDYRKDYCDNFANIIVLVRPETYQDIITKNLADHLNSDNVIPWYQCVISPTCGHNILTHKSNVCKCPSSLDIIRKKDKMKSRIEKEDFFERNQFVKLIPNELVDFEKFSREYIKGIMSAIRSKYISLDKYYGGKDYSSFFSIEDFEDTSQFLEIIFNDNIRAFVDNFINSYAVVKLACKKKIPGATAFSRYPQYLLLNGRLFLDSPNVSTRVRGDAYPNLFWWNHSWVDDNISNWFGLSGIRILQLLIAEENILLSRAVDVLEFIFYYPDNLVRKQIDRLVRYGIIKYSDTKIASGDYYLRITEKGKFALEFTFIYTDWLYFCAIDTPLDKELCAKNDTRYIKISRDFNYDFITSFNAAYITTVITFYRHMHTQQILEEDLIRNNWDLYSIKENRNGLFRNLNHAYSFFSFPKHFKFFLQRNIELFFIGLYRRAKLDRRAKLELEQLHKDLTGLYPELIF